MNTEWKTRENLQPEILKGDCLENFKLLKQPKFDAIITDPPFNISRENNFKTLKGADRQGIDFGEWDKNFDNVGWIAPAIDLLKPGGTVLIFNSWQNLGLLKEELEKNNCVVKDIIRWIKPNPMPRNMNRRYVVDYEFILWAVKKGGKWTFNNKKTGYLRPEYNFPSPTKKVRIHPTQKPVKLINELLKVHTNEGDRILDPFAGSGAVGIACIKTGRKYLGIEIDPEYHKKASIWLEQVRIKKVEETPLPWKEF